MARRVEGPSISALDLTVLINFLSNVEDHVRCKDPHNETHKYYPYRCLETILERFAYNDIARIKEVLEAILISHSTDL